jgi:hypothetical protein
MKTLAMKSIFVFAFTCIAIFSADNTMAQATVTTSESTTIKSSQNDKPAPPLAVDPATYENSGSNEIRVIEGRKVAVDKNGIQSLAIPEEKKSSTTTDKKNPE